jgi:Nucleoside-diphosphate-sugar pyrophosphorylase involved in lipopolysaccharide biosynthesis/translation initiation factor 2B, gamma/epsilon subunits (eIF-2Bgamma/eIF-2Bepsilon)
VKAVVLAAGLGTRLRPLTFFVPKALAAAGSKTLIDLVIEWLRLNGIREIAVVGHYMQDLLRSYLLQFHPDVAFLPSRRLLGTAGQLYYAKGWIEGDAVVANTDVLTNLALEWPLQLHKSKEALLTVVGAVAKTSLRFGVLEAEDGRLKAWREKPSFEYIMSTGIYIISDAVVKRLSEEYLDMDSLAQSLTPRVAVYTAKEAFFYDVGTLEDLAKAREVEIKELKP